MNAKAGEHRRSELCGLTSQSLRATIGPLQANRSLLHYVIGISGILPYNRNVTLPTFLSITRDFFRLHSTFARLYNAAASPASRLRSAGSLAIILWVRNFYNFGKIGYTYWYSLLKFN